MSLNLPNPLLKSIIITPVNSRTTESGRILIDYRTKINVTIKDTSPAGTTKYEWMNIPNFTKYMKLVACQAYYRNYVSQIEEVLLRETATPLSRSTIVSPSAEDVEGWQPSSYASLGPSYKYSEKMRHVLASGPLGGFNVSTPAENQSYKSDEFSRLYISADSLFSDMSHNSGQIEFQEISLEAARSPRATNPTFAANDQTSYDINFTFEFDLKEVPANGVNQAGTIVMNPNGPLENLTHLVFLDFDFYQALEDAGVKQLVNSDSYRRSQEVEFSKSLSSRSKVIKSIVNGKKTPTLTYRSLADGTPYNGPAVRRTELVRQPDGTFIREPINDLLYDSDSPTALRILERSVPNNKVHYLNPFTVTSYPTYDQMKERAAVANNILSSLNLTADEYRRSFTSALREPFFSEIPSYVEDGVVILNMTAEEERQISNEERYSPIKLKVVAMNPEMPQIELSVDYDKLFLQKSAYYQLYKNMPAGTRVRLLRELSEQSEDPDVIRPYFKLRFYEQPIEYSMPRLDPKSNIVIKKPEQRKYFEPASTLNNNSAMTTFVYDLLTYDKASFTSCVYGCEIEFVDPIAEEAVRNIDLIKQAVNKMKDFYNHAMVPAFGLTNEAKTSIYGLGNNVVFSEPTEFVGSIDHETGLYTQDFAATVENGREYSPVTVREFHNHLDDGGVISQGLESYRFMKELVFSRGDNYEILDRFQNLLRVTTSGSPKLLEILINDMDQFLTVLNNIFGSYSMDLSNPTLKKMTKPIIKYNKEFSDHPIAKSDREIMYYDHEGILKSEPTYEEEEQMREWWE